MNIRSLLAPIALLCCGQAIAQVSQFGLDSRPSNTTCLAPARPTNNAVVALEAVFPTAPAFISPTKMLQAPNDSSRWFVLEQAGPIKRFDVANPAAATVYLDWTARVYSSTDSEGGLLGMAFHPDFPNTPEVFISYTARTGVHAQPMVSTLSRLVLDNPVTPVNITEQVILTVTQTTGIHKGGDIAFGADGYLYLSLGDGGVTISAQDTTDLHGTMLRIDVLGVPWPNPGYNIPASNPFSGNPKCGPTRNTQACPEIYAWGFRNPWRWSFDRQTGALWLGDVGQDAWEEVDFVERGGNYGWRCHEGTHDYITFACPASGLIDPVIEYSHTVGTSVIGGYVYRGTAIPELQGRYVFGDYTSGTFWALKDDGQGGYTMEVIADTNARPTSFALDSANEIYFTDHNGRIYRLRPATAPTPDTIPADLAATGCANPGNPSQSSSGLVPYAINAPFWSDGAEKSRFLGVPDGMTINMDASGDWELPAGSVIRKDFRLGTQLVETRLLMRHPDGVWAGYTYEWNDAQTAATRVKGGKTRQVNGQTWIYPSEGQCMQCHTAAAGFSLGLETAQLNRNETYPSTGRTADQLTTLAHIGMFSAPLPPGSPGSLPRLVDPADASQVTHARARAWLHTNCAQCHRPDGPTPAFMDLRYSTPLQSMNVCNVAPNEGDLGIANARLVAQGDAAHSVLTARASRRDVNGMPPLGSNLVDAADVSTVIAWINNLGSCQDTDNDLADDTRDNCASVANTSQRDTDADGYGNACDADLDNSGMVTFPDLALFRQRFGTTNADADFNGDSTVNFTDLAVFRQLFGKSPGPSGLHP